MTPPRPPLPRADVLIDPGLDLTKLRRLRTPRHDTDVIQRRIAAHLDHHAGYLPISGGKDSTIVTHLACQVRPDVQLVFFDSGLEYPETYTYLEHLAESWDLNLHIEPADINLLDALVADGSWDHHAPQARRAINLHDALITGPATRAHARYGPGELWGVRADEAAGRAALYATALAQESARSCRGCCTTPRQRRERHGGVVRRRDHTVAYGPIWNWSSEDVLAHAARHDIPLNPVYAKLQALGAPPHAQRLSHLLDGSRLEEGRVTWLRVGWPDLFDQLADHLPRIREHV